MKKKLFIIGLILLAGLFMLASVHLYLRWTHQYYFGQVVKVSADSFIMKTSKEEVTVQISEKTLIKEDANGNFKQIEVGRSVIVIGPIHEGKVDAKLVRPIKFKSK
jgi:hypothetical protein